MRIGFDAKRAFHNFTGLGNYSRTLLETFATHCPDYDLQLFTPKNNENDHRINEFLKNIEKKGDNTGGGLLHTPQTFFGKKMGSFWRSYGIVDDLKRARTDVFHGLSHELPIGIERTNIRTVVTMHDLIFERFPQFYPFLDRKMYAWKFKSAARRAHQVVAISQQTKKDLIDFYHIPEEKIRVIYQSCDAQFFETPPPSIEAQKAVLARYNLPDDYILYVGTVNERKNLMGLVAAMYALRARLGDAMPPLVVIGKGKEYLHAVKNYISEKKLSKKIIFKSDIDFKDMPNIYRSAHVFVYPSFFEGFGIPIIESLFSGTAVVTSEGSCFGEAGGAGALYANPHDSESIADAIQRVLTDSALQNQLVAEGFQHVQQFLPSQVAKNWRNVYQNV
ncbi:MAG: hypothetical protein RL757_1259 [Bacteroidota bacterium]|jgi:glycosyltransferase involved in cell wall biosynthesis